MSLFRKDVLLVDDDFELSSLMANYLSDAFKVVQLHDVADIQIYLSKTSIDAAVLDFHLDVSNGFEIYQKLIQIQPDVPVIFLSADPRVAELVSDLNQSNCRFLPKPLIGDELLDSLKSLFVEQEEGLQPSP